MPKSTEDEKHNHLCCPYLHIGEGKDITQIQMPRLSAILEVLIGIWRSGDESGNHRHMDF